MWSETANIVARELLKGSYVLRHCKHHVKRGFQRKVKPEAVLGKACSPKQASAQTLSILEPKSLHRQYVGTMIICVPTVSTSVPLLFVSIFRGYIWPLITQNNTNFNKS